MGCAGVTAGQSGIGRFVAYRDAEGNMAIHVGGTPSWRNNNPGNINYGSNAIRFGAIGQNQDGRAIFPDFPTGWNAAHSLLTGTDTYNYWDMTIH